MNIAFHFPKCVITTGIGQEAEFAAVPDATFMRNMPAGFISTIPACSSEWSECWARVELTTIRSNPSNRCETNVLFLKTCSLKIFEPLLCAALASSAAAKLAFLNERGEIRG